MKNRPTREPELELILKPFPIPVPAPSQDAGAGTGRGNQSKGTFKFRFMGKGEKSQLVVYFPLCYPRPVPKSENQLNLAVITLLIVLLIRLLTLGSPGIVDPSEARFAIGAQQMLLSGDWIIPKIYSGKGEWEAFSSKPPLQYWLIAASFKLFGMNNWAARLPSFLSLALTCALVILFCRKFFSASVGILSALILSSAAGFYYFSVACLSDTTLTAAVTLAIVSLAFSVSGGSKAQERAWGNVFFLALALGFLTKGPVVLILSLGAIGIWIVTSRDLTVLKKLPWISGAVIFFGVALPWFIMVERATPGFLWDFFVYENFLRYFTSDFALKVGTLHKQPYGMVWLMLLAVFVPWSLILLKGLFALVFNSRFRSRTITWLPSLRSKENEWLCLVVLWAFWPTLFLTFMKQLHPTYIFPALPAYAILVSQYLHSVPTIPDRSNTWQIRAIYAPLVLTLGFIAVALIRGSTFSYLTIALLVLGLAVLWYQRAVGAIAFCGSFCIFLASITVAFGDDITARRSTEFVLEAIRRSYPKGTKVAFVQNNPLSAQFYSRSDGDFQIAVVSPLNFDQFLDSKIDLGFIRTRDLEGLPKESQGRLKTMRVVGSWTMIAAN